LKAIDVAFQVASYYKGFMPGIIEQMYLQIELGKWDIVLDICMQIQGLEADQTDMLFVLTVYHLFVKGDNEKGFEYLENLRLAIDRKEPQNHEFFFKVCQVCSRICNDPRYYFLFSKT
jgi:hypothetical protein